jgi:transcriptional regulator NrdR family protein
MATAGDNRETASRRGLACPGCGCAHFRVLYTRRSIGGRILRRRECRHCGRRVTTYEAASA